MPASEAQIRSNQANAQKSTGPKTEAGKNASRANSYKHGLTATKVFPELEAVEVQRRYLSYCSELNPTGDIGFSLALRAATLSTRMERCVTYETAMLTDRVRQVEADFVPPEGVDAVEAERLRKEAGKRALFDDSREATLARKYEAAAERGFFKAINELRLIEKQKKVAREAKVASELASILPTNLGEMSDDEFEVFYAQTMARANGKPVDRIEPVDFEALKGRIDVPISAGKRR
jgi:hypothetical protein